MLYEKYPALFKQSNEINITAVFYPSDLLVDISLSNLCIKDMIAFSLCSRR